MSKHYISLLGTLRLGYCVLGAQGLKELNEAYDNYINDKQNPLDQNKLMRNFNDDVEEFLPDEYFDRAFSYINKNQEV